MRHQNIRAKSAHAISAPPVFVALAALLLIVVCASQGFATAIPISNTEIRDTWTNSLPAPVYNDPNPDKFLLNSDRQHRILDPPFQVLFPDPLTMNIGRGEGLIAANEASYRPGGIDLSDLDTALEFEATFGSANLQTSSVVGLVWNFVDPSVNPVMPHYRFQFGHVENGNPGIAIVRRGPSGSESVLFSDPTIGLSRLSTYDFSVTRSPLTPNAMTVAINKTSGAGDPLAFSYTVSDTSPLGAGAIGLYVDNVNDAQWDDIAAIPEPNTMALAVMGGLGLLIFVGLRQRRRMTVDMVL